MNKGANGYTRANTQSRNTWQTLDQGLTMKHNPRQAERIQEQGFRVSCSWYCYQQPGWCIEYIRSPKRNIGSRPVDTGKSPNYPHWRWKAKTRIRMEEISRHKGISTKNRGNAFSIIRNQCQKVLMDKTKSDTDWEILEQSGNPLLLIQVIENIYYPRQSIYTHLIQCTNRNWHFILSTIMISQMTRGMRILTHSQTSSTLSEWLENTRYCLSTWLRKKNDSLKKMQDNKK